MGRMDFAICGVPLFRQGNGRLENDAVAYVLSSPLIPIYAGRGFSMAHAPQFLKLVNEAKKKVKETNVADVKRRIEAGEKFLLVDVREDNEWTKGHLPGAVHLGKGIIERDIE